MTISELAGKLNLETVIAADPERTVSGGYTCDLLSWVIGRANENDAWITIISNVNTIAVALLSGVSCVILAENAELDPMAAKKASEEKINVLRSPKNNFRLSAELYAALIPIEPGNV